MKKNDVFSYSFIVTPDVYNGFIQVFNDTNPLHTDPDFAREHGFNDAVMHGNILNGFLSYFIGELLPVKNVVILTQKIKFSNPVYLNDQLSFRAEIIGFYESVNVFEFEYRFDNKNKLVVANGEIQIRVI